MSGIDRLALRRLSRQRRYQKNKEKTSKLEKAYREANKAKIKVRARKYYRENAKALKLSKAFNISLDKARAILLEVRK